MGVAQEWKAWTAGTDPVELARANSRARDDFLSHGATRASLRSLVLESWRRCLLQGVTPDGPDPRVVAPDDLADYRAAHPLASVMPVVRQLLVQDAVEADLIVAVSDAEGRLLWVEGSRPLRRRAEGMHFIEGAVWSEGVAGTNAPGTALALDHALQIFGAEHLRSPVTPWSCTAAPIHAPDGQLLGALDLTGGDDVAAPHTLRLVCAVAAAAEAELRAQHLSRRVAGIGARPAPRPPAAAVPAGLKVLGRVNGELSTAAGTIQLRPRHGELLLVLAEHEAGLSAEQLEAALHERPASVVTARAEISRLRTLLADVDGPQITSRPYRLAPGLRTDVARVRADLRAGRLAEALARYTGPVLPGSLAPAVRGLREDLHRDVREAVLISGPPALVLAFARREQNVWDAELWRAAAERHPEGSPQHAEAVSRCDRLDRDLAAPRVTATLGQPPAS
jgi:hypothetical protein